ncbi:hydrogenase expression/formation C-terminal domain-containing protein [uncultured Lamprocystis sp.]|jgi:hydrogenase-1 operon protein HyaF|uniref:hydrogenase expression/formation C-terminal domain-containing protein n=1 Tax=uncultured Lamprocystis sp. TaxID=543132 RepID=UPI0025D6536A|nr:hydrogenase expression/formation C-terminal domain-containing protein [uncultured Lamprocystis sp.]
MTRLSDIPVQAEPGESQVVESPLVTAILNNIANTLAQFLTSKVATAIDLRAVPHMDAATYQSLKDALSVGEVSAKVETDVTIEIRETQYSGIWWVTHRNEQGSIVTELIEITDLPDILKSHVIDMRAGLQRLRQALAEPSPP